MKKSIILAGTVFLALVACNKTPGVVTEENHGSAIAFKAITSMPTKATENAQLAGTTLGATNANVRMVVSASTRTANGAVQNADYFSNQQFGYNNVANTWIPGTPTAATATTETPIYWPMGGSVVDFLAYALYNVTGESTTWTPSVSPFVLNPDGGGSCTITWGNGGEPDVKADKLVFADADIFSNKVDLMYASANFQQGGTGSTADYRSVPLVFHHAGAVIDIDITSSQAITINEIKFANLVTEKSSFETNEYATLDKVGTLTIDNTYTTLKADWSAIDQGTSTVYANLVAFNDGVTDGADTWKNTSLTASTKTSVSDVIVMPQSKLNFIIKYTMGGKEFYVTAPVKKGFWVAGHKYVYDITMSFQKIEVVESVIDFTTEATEAQTIQ